MIEPDIQYLKEDVKRIISKVFEWNPPWHIIWRTDIHELVHSFRPCPKWDDIFVENVIALFYKEFPGAGEVRALEESYESDGNAWCIQGRVPTPVFGSCFLLISHLAPVATIHFTHKEVHAWELTAPDLLEPISASEFEHIDHLAREIAPLLAQQGYFYLPQDSEVFHQPIRSGLFTRTKAWNYLFALISPWVQ